MTTTIMTPEWANIFDEWMNKDFPNRQPPQGLMKDWNTPLSLKEQIEETNPPEEYYTGREFTEWFKKSEGLEPK